jgi:hypothetical protein
MDWIAMIKGHLQDMTFKEKQLRRASEDAAMKADVVRREASDLESLLDKLIAANKPK